MTTITTEQFADFWIKKIAFDKTNNTNTKFDFSITEIDLPFDWDEEIFMNLFKEKFELKTIKIDSFTSRYRCSGEFVLDFKIDYDALFLTHK